MREGYCAAPDRRLEFRVRGKPKIQLPFGRNLGLEDKIRVREPETDRIASPGRQSRRLDRKTSHSIGPTIFSFGQGETNLRKSFALRLRRASGPVSVKMNLASQGQYKVMDIRRKDSRAPPLSVGFGCSRRCRQAATLGSVAAPWTEANDPNFAWSENKKYTEW